MLGLIEPLQHDACNGINRMCAYRPGLCCQYGPSRKEDDAVPHNSLSCKHQAAAPASRRRMLEAPRGGLHTFWNSALVSLPRPLPSSLQDVLAEGMTCNASAPAADTSPNNSRSPKLWLRPMRRPDAADASTVSSLYNMRGWSCAYANCPINLLGKKLRAIRRRRRCCLPVACMVGGGDIKICIHLRPNWLPNLSPVLEQD